MSNGREVEEERIRALRLVLEAADRFDEYVDVLRRSADRADAAEQLAATFGCSPTDAAGFLIPLPTHRLVLPESVSHLREELANLESPTVDPSEA